MKETKDVYFNPLNKIKWGPDERSASDFALNVIVQWPPGDSEGGVGANPDEGGGAVLSTFYMLMYFDKQA